MLEYGPGEGGADEADPRGEIVLRSAHGSDVRVGDISGVVVRQRGRCVTRGKASFRGKRGGNQKKA